ncbi:MAG: hypothetical protein ACJAZM_000592 [Cyclobacteriaceae bacterium]|jgi:hypothetical protein
MKKNYGLLVTILLVWTFTFAQEKKIHFDVMYKDGKVGVLHALETKTKTKSLKILTIETSASFFFISIHMESEISTTQKKGVLIEGAAYRNASRKSSDVIATVKKTGFRRYKRELNGVKDEIKNQHITFCVVDLYFKEPIGVEQVFSNMHAKMLQMKRVSVGKYRLITPDNKDSLYSYKAGKLVSIEANTLVGKVLSKRI